MAWVEVLESSARGIDDAGEKNTLGSARAAPVRPARPLIPQAFVEMQATFEQERAGHAAVVPARAPMRAGCE